MSKLDTEISIIDDADQAQATVEHICDSQHAHGVGIIAARKSIMSDDPTFVFFMVDHDNEIIAHCHVDRADLADLLTSIQANPSIN